jgi:ABC-type multidrug transport system fused ATPase/permease subunit
VSAAAGSHDVSLRESARRLVRFVGDARPMLGLALFIAGTQSLLLAPVALLVRRVFDHSIPQQDSGEIVLIAAATMALYVTSTALALVSRRLAITVTERAVSRLRVELLARLYELPLEWHDKRDPGVLHSVVVADGDRFELLATHLAHSVIPASLTAGGLAVVAVIINPLLAGVVLAVAAVFVLGSRRLAKRSRRAGRGWHAHYARFSAETRVALRAMPLTKAHGGESWEMGRRRAQAVDMAGSAAEFGGARSDYIAVINGAAGAIGAIILLVGGLEVVSGAITVGQLIAFYAVGGLAMRQVAVASSLANAHAGAESLRQLEELLDAHAAEPYSGTVVHEPLGAVEMGGVTFGYGTEPVLIDVDLEISPGEHVALLGPNGSGKSTIVNLLIGLYAPSQGEVTIDGVPLGEIDVRAFRRRIGIVLQDPIILPGTIAENIAYSRDAPARAEIAAAAQAATAAGFIEALPNGYETQVGEEGVRLSGGQRQRIAIARALFGAPRLLILDEPTTYLDHAAILNLLETLNGLANAPTVLLVTHDPAVAARADRVVHLRDGRIERIEAGHELGASWELAPVPEMGRDRPPRSSAAAAQDHTPRAAGVAPEGEPVHPHGFDVAEAGVEGHLRERLD